MSKDEKVAPENDVNVESARSVVEYCHHVCNKVVRKGTNIQSADKYSIYFQTAIFYLERSWIYRLDLMRLRMCGTNIFGENLIKVGKYFPAIGFSDVICHIIFWVEKSIASCIFLEKLLLASRIKVFFRFWI